MYNEVLYEKKVERELIKLYDINSINKVTYLGKSDNVTFCIETIDNNKYLFKHHMGTNEKRVIESELLWLEALEANTSLNIQRPVRNINNQLTTNIIDEKTGNHSFWTLQVWIEGKTLDRQPTDVELEKLAQLMVTLHGHSVCWIVPETFERPSYNAENLLNSLNQLKQMLPLNIMSSDNYKVLQKTTDKIVKVINSQEKNSDDWGIIHSDIHESNYVFNQGKPFVIDFSSCGFGFYLFDIAETFLHLIPKNREKLITYYQQERNLQRDYIELLEAFFIWAIIRNFAFLSKNVNEHNELSKNIPMVVEKFCRKYLKEERFLFN
ncbi:phosphotransferase enzyme family protein [Bacillus solitudinis]|uniref:phosphotransferase enzyme family protein n=1 Tax=Bacillus solitudinis TaxID=2014074 RepID=UPI000C24E18A|nr:phosphotransferase [Bacillus solitudinis]